MGAMFGVKEVPLIVLQYGSNSDTRRTFDEGMHSAGTYGALRRWLMQVVEDAQRHFNELPFEEDPAGPWADADDSAQVDPTESISSTAQQGRGTAYTRLAYGEASCPPGFEILSVDECVGHRGNASVGVCLHRFAQVLLCEREHRDKWKRADALQFRYHWTGKKRSGSSVQESARRHESFGTFGTVGWQSSWTGPQRHLSAQWQAHGARGSDAVVAGGALRSVRCTGWSSAQMDVAGRSVGAKGEILVRPTRVPIRGGDHGHHTVCPRHSRGKRR